MMKIQTQVNCVTEIAFQSTAIYADPYSEATMDVAFAGPSGTITVPAFWAGGQTWKARFSGGEPGEYIFETACSNARDTGLHGQSGSIEVVPYRGENPLLRHGRVRVAASQRSFEHADGTPFFWVGDTWWMGLTKRLDWPEGFKQLAADRVEKGFNVVQIIAGPLPDMDAWDPRGRNEAGHPFTKDFASINPAYFDLADLKLGHLVYSGLMPCIVGMWGYYLPQIGVQKVKRFWRYLVARYGAYPVAWCICGEGKMSYYLSKTPEADSQQQQKGWTEVMAYVRQISSYGNMITIHPTNVGRDQVDDPSLMHFEMLQTGHSDLRSVASTSQAVRKSVDRRPMMPVVNSEVNYEGILGYAWQNIQRLCFYNTVLNGAAGHTYGANGIWQMCTEAEPYGASPHGRCWGNVPWHEAARLPGSRQIGLGGRFMHRFPWWDLERHAEWIEPAPKEEDPYSTIAAGIPGQVRLFYVPHLWNVPTIKGIESEVRYRASYFDPVRGIDVELGLVEPDAQGNWQPPLPPEVHDWLLVLDAREEAEE